MLNDLNDLNATIAHAADLRPWVALTRREICTNCGHEHSGAPLAMREERKGHYVRATFAPPEGTVFKSVDAPAFFAWCEKCSGEKPLTQSLLKAIESSTSDRDLAQRAGHILADWLSRKKSRNSDV